MKPHGTRSDFETQRYTELLASFRHHMGLLKTRDMNEVYNAVVASPCKRFWVSEERAAIVMARIERGDELLEMRPQRREMFCEIYRRCILLREKEPDLSWIELTTKVVCQPAPKWYMAAGSARLIIYKAKRWLRKKLKTSR